MQAQEIANRWWTIHIEEYSKKLCELISVEKADSDPLRRVGIDMEKLHYCKLFEEEVRQYRYFVVRSGMWGMGYGGVLCIIG